MPWPGLFVACNIAPTCAEKKLAQAGAKYVVQMDIDCLRSYTRQVAFEQAIEHQLVLSELRDQLAGEKDEIWSPPYQARR